MSQLGLFDKPLPKPTEIAVEDRDSGMQASSEKSGDEWAEYALDFVRSYLRTHRQLFVDDLWKSGLRRPESARALGAVIKRASTNGWMRHLKHSGCILARRSTSSNMQLKAVWESLIFGTSPC